MSELQSLLRSADHLRGTLKCTTTNSQQKLLAVVSHIDEFDRHEEGSLFLVKDSDDLYIEHAFPIIGSFSISMEQVRRETLDLTRPSLDQPRTGFRIIISSGVAEPVSLFTNDVQALRNILGEVKRLKALSDSKSADASTPQTYSWLAPYTSHDSAYPILSSTPTDLRLAHTPLQTRLSSTRPGVFDTDTEDLLLIRDEWLRQRVRAQGTKGKRRISIRIGTFNVNGNLPSQDLSPWIRGLGHPSESEDKQSSPLDDYRASAILSERLERQLSTTDSTFSVRSSASTEAIPPSASASTFSTLPSSSSFTLTNGRLSMLSASSTGEPQVAAEPVDKTSPEDPDLFALGFQELDLSAEALLYSTSTVKEDAWCRAIFAALGEKAVHYEKLVSKQLVGMLLVILVKKSLKSCFSDIQTAAVGAGIMGLMGNKGGTAVRLTFTPPAGDEKDLSPGPTVLTFVNAHLAAFDEMFERRNADFHDLSKRLLFDHPSEPNSLEKVNIYESDVLFWMGDLNYRIDIADQDIRGILTSENWHDKFQVLHRYDQLKAAMSTKKAFDLFSEAPLSRFPTYRFSPGLLKDELGYDLKRKPAWTDRILYLCSPFTAQVLQHSYNGHLEITMSDHRPVSADFTVNVDVYDHDQCERTAEKLFRKIQGIEHSLERVSFKLDNTTLDFGDVFFKQATSRKLTLRNIGKVPCGFRFVPMDDQGPEHPDWLRIEPMTGILLPDEVLDLTMTAFVDNNVAAHLNLSSRQLDSTLILHTFMGKDHFISINGTFQYTCFSNSIQRLVRLPDAIRSLKNHDDLLPEERAINAPREIMRLVNWFMTTKQNLDDVFVEQADPNLVGVIRESLDTGSDFPFPAESDDPKIPIAFGDTLVQLLDSLTEPVIPVSSHASCVTATNRDEAFELLDELPPAAVNVWISITAFLHYIARSSVAPAARAEKLAATFAPVLLKDNPFFPRPAVSPIGKRAFLLHFISL